MLWWWIIRIHMHYMYIRERERMTGTVIELSLFDLENKKKYGEKISNMRNPRVQGKNRGPAFALWLCIKRQPRFQNHACAKLNLCTAGSQSAQRNRCIFPPINATLALQSPLDFWITTYHGVSQLWAWGPGYKEILPALHVLCVESAEDRWTIDLIISRFCPVASRTYDLMALFLSIDLRTGRSNKHDIHVLATFCSFSKYWPAY